VEQRKAQANLLFGRSQKWHLLYLWPSKLEARYWYWVGSVLFWNAAAHLELRLLSLHLFCWFQGLRKYDFHRPKEPFRQLSRLLGSWHNSRKLFSWCFQILYR